MKKTIGYLLLESLLIGLSVFAAFWLENYREDRQTDKVKIEYYKRIKSDLINDTIEWAKIGGTIRIQKNRISDILKELAIPTKNLEELTIMLFQVERELAYYDLYSFTDKSFTFNSIVNGERGGIFEGDSTFIEIQEYYSYKNMFLHDIKSYETYCENNITPYMDKYFDRQSVRYNPDKRFRFEILKTPNHKLADFQRKEFLNYLMNSTNYLLPEAYVEFSKQYSKGIIKLIDRELQKK